jgi:hypothetical protein
VPERSVPRDANAVGYRFVPPLEVGSILELLRGDDEDHVFGLVVVEQFIYV